MITISKLKEDLQKIIPTAFMRFEEYQELPFCVIIDAGSNNIYADNIAYFKRNKLRIELYTEFIDFEMQEKIEAYFEKEKIGWIRSEAGYIEEEEMYTVFYFI